MVCTRSIACTRICACAELGDAELPLELPDGQSPLLARLLVYSGASLAAFVLPPLPPLSLYMEPVVVRAGEGLSWPARGGAQLDVGAAPQDVLALLGPPARVFYKHEDKMRIHAAAADEQLAKGDYFYNYPALGLDVMFGVARPMHVLKKFVLHSNFPSHPDFNQCVPCHSTPRLHSAALLTFFLCCFSYAKCFWKLPVPRKAAGGAGAAPAAADVLELDSSCTWDDMQKQLGPTGKPLMYVRLA